MRSFWGFFDNGTYRVGCNGATVYLYDQNDSELARFKDIPYVYSGVFQPGTNIFVAKSTDGSLAVYDLDRRALLKKIFITRIGAQDEGIAFSPDGRLLYNIEKPTVSTRTQLTVYETSGYTAVETLFADRPKMFLDSIEFYGDEKYGFVLGFMGDETEPFNHYFIGRLYDNEISEIRETDAKRYDYIRAYMLWKQMGFTEKALKWSTLMYYAERPHIDMREVYNNL